MEQKPRRGGLVWPVILIGLGIVFLLNNLGMLSWDVWDTIFRMWPVILIAIGLDLIIGRRSVWGSLLALVLIVAVLGGGIWLAQTSAGSSTQSAATETVNYALGNATRAEVTISPAVGDLRVRALSGSSTTLAQGSIELVRGETLSRSFTSGGTARLSLSTSKRSWGPAAFGWKNARIWSLGLNPGVPTDLHLDMAVGQVDADLTGMKLEGLDVELAVGQITLRLPAEGVYNVKVSAAIGEIVVEVPSGMAVRVHAGVALAGREFPSGYERSGEYYISPTFLSARNRVEVEADLAIGNLVVREVR
jgi:hypothetical protein